MSIARRALWIILLCYPGSASFAQLQSHTPEPHTLTWVAKEPEIATGIPSKYKGFRGLVIREKLTIEYFPVLPIIFFEEGTSSIPSRYEMLSGSADAQQFDPDTVTTALGGYYSYLDLLGWRLRHDSSARITLVGCTSLESAAERSLALARSRARAVKDYLVRVWGVDSGRIATIMRRLPEYPSPANTRSGNEENRRVEVQSSAWSIVKPLREEQSVRWPDPSELRLQIPMSRTTTKLLKREIVIKVNDEEWMRQDVDAHSDSTQTFVWTVHHDPAWRYPTTNAILSAHLLETDVSGHVSEVSCDTLPVVVQDPYDGHVRIPEGREHWDSPDSIVELYHLTFLPSEVENIGMTNRKYLDNVVVDRIRPKTGVSITGAMDTLSKYSEGRCKTLLRSIKRHLVSSSKVRSDQIVLGSSVEGRRHLYDNATPEGRFLNRYARIRIATPIDHPLFRQ